MVSLFTTVCNGCGKYDKDMITTFWASGNHHYCSKCWPKHRDFYDDETGQQTWVRIGNYYEHRWNLDPPLPPFRRS